MRFSFFHPKGVETVHFTGEAEGKTSSFFCLLASKERRRRRLVELEQTAGGQESGARNHEKQMKINNCFSFFSPHLVLSPIKLLGAVMSDDDDGYRNNKTEKERKAIKHGRFSLALEL